MKRINLKIYTMKKIILLASGLMILVAACKKKEDAAPTTTTTTTTTITPTSAGKTTFNARIKPILTAKCATSGCHTAGGQSPDLTTYASSKSNITGILGRMNLSATSPYFMPLGSSKVQADIDSIAKWNTDGLLEQ
jgi:hypothetical protein